MKWTKQGRTFYLNDKEMFYINRSELENSKYNITPCECDAIGYFILEALQNGNIKEYYNNYMKI